MKAKTSLCAHTCVCGGTGSGGVKGHLEITKPFLFDSCFSFHILSLSFQLDWIQASHLIDEEPEGQSRKVRFFPGSDLGPTSLCFLACVLLLRFDPLSPILREIYHYRLYCIITSPTMRQNLLEANILSGSIASACPGSCSDCLLPI